MFSTAIRKKRAVGVLLFLVILALFFSFNRLPKLDIVGEDLDSVSAPEAQCFQGFCIEREAGTSFLTKWWSFSVTYLRLVTVGMTFAFLMAGLMESFLVPQGSGRTFLSGGTFSRTVKGAALGPVMNLCSACIVPVSSAFQRSGAGIAGAIALVQGSATMNIPALAMVFFVFTPLLGMSRLLLAVVGALLIGPIVLMTIRKRGGEASDEEEQPPPMLPQVPDTSPWRPVMAEAFRDWSKTSVGYLARMGPIMVAAGFASGLAIQWLSPETVSTYLGNHLLGVVVAATFGILVNVPLLFEIPLVALLLLLGMGTAPAATLLFTAAAGGPVTFWGLGKLMPKRAIATFATATWSIGTFGGLAILGVGTFIWEVGDAAPLSPLYAVQSQTDATTSVPTSGDCGLPAGIEAVTERANPDNDPPVAIDDSGAGRTETALVIDILCNDIDIDRDTLVITNLVQPANGKVTVGPDDVVTYISDAGFVGTDTFTYTANDGTFDSQIATVTATVAALTDIRFVDRAASAGVAFEHIRDEASLSVGSGAAVGDYDGDGLLDIYVTNSAGRNALYHNNGDNTFTDVAKKAGVAGPLASASGTGWADYDNDGDLDLFVASYGMSRLYRNDGDGSFSDVTDEAGVADPDDSHRSTGIAWGDYDSDGDLDLLVVRFLIEDDLEAFVSRFFREAVRPLALYRNNGDGTFANATALLGDASSKSISNLEGSGFTPSFFDYDNDGDMDIYVVNDFGADVYPNVLWRNDGDGTFTDVSKESGTDIGLSGMGLAVGDYDNDGDLDMHMTDIGPSVFLENMADGTFLDRTVETGTGRGVIEEPDGRLTNSVGWGSVFADLDNDGFLDIYQAAGFLDRSGGLSGTIQPNVVFLNNGDGTFSDVSDQTGADDKGTSREVVAADFTGDGRIDLFVVSIGRVDGSAGKARLYQNFTENSNSWLSFELIGTTSNRFGIGARITVTAGGVSRIREHATHQGHTSHSVVPTHFGLGDASLADTVEVRWPSGIVQRLTDVPVNQQVTVTEP